MQGDPKPKLDWTLRLWAEASVFHVGLPTPSYPSNLGFGGLGCRVTAP